MTTTWTQLRSTAMLGLARRSVTDLEIDGIGMPTDAEPGARFLAATALAGARRRAGAIPTAAPAAPSAAHDETLPIAPVAATQLLDLVIGGALGRPAESQPLLSHWLRAAADARCIVPSTLLIPLLDRAVAAPGLQPSIAVVIGERGRWLAAQREDWATMFQDGDGSTVASLDELDQLPKAARSARLQEARRTDPTAVRAWIEERWETDRAADRALNVAALAVAVSTDDEALLERALDDRAVAVRDAAATALDRLPTSRRAERLASVLAPLVDRPGRLRRRLSVTALPHGVDLSRDLPAKTMGATLLRNLLVSAPLRVWQEATGLAPTDLLRYQTDPDDLRDLWIRAAIAQRNEPWLWALIATDPVPARVGEVIAAAPGPWTAAQSSAVVTALRRHKLPSHLLDSAGTEMSERLHHDALDDLERWRSRLAAGEQALDRRIRTLVQHLSTRRSISEAFS